MCTLTDDVWQAVDREWHLLWCTSALLCLVAGIGFSLLAGRGRSVTLRPTEPPPAGAVTQSVELQVPHESAMTNDDVVDSVEPGVPLMIQHRDLAAAATQGWTRCPGDIAAVLDNNIVARRQSLTDSPAAESTSHFTHGQLISIV